MEFYKMHGAGNDFIMINNYKENLPLDKVPQLAQVLCQRALSIGADALIIADRPEKGGDVQMRFYNADGSIGEMCGNGVRCLARFAYENKLAGKTMAIETLAGFIHAERNSERIYTTDLNEAENGIEYMDVDVDGVIYNVAYIELGNPGLPHVVLRINGLSDMDKEDLRQLGKGLRYNKAFPKGANVNFYDIIDESTVKLLTYERGVEDFTLACGTGSGSTALTVRDKGEIKSNRINLIVPGGTLSVNIKEIGNGKVKLFLTGETNIVAKGIITDEDLTNF